MVGTIWNPNKKIREMHNSMMTSGKGSPINFRHAANLVHDRDFKIDIISQVKVGATVSSNAFELRLAKVLLCERRSPSFPEALVL